MSRSPSRVLARSSLLVRAAALCALGAPLFGAAPRGAAEAQARPRTDTAWNDARTIALVQRAVERRARQLADTALRDYKATARGYLTFLAQLGEGFTEPPRIVKADELALEVYWRAPNLSKQLIIGRRDTLLLPTDIQYHRDHLGIVQNNFPDVIRLGEGDEVSDVPHPLSSAGQRAYDFSIRDSLGIRLPDRTIDVYEVRVRPRDDRQPRLIGAVYLDRADGEVVRMAFNFTRAAFLDKQLEDLSIVLENALVSARFWLPRRQEIEIRRTGTWLDYPVRGIIRGRWEICCYQVNAGTAPQFFLGPEIALAPARDRARHTWSGRILDSLPPDVRAVTDEDVRRVQDEARRLVRAQALARATGTTLSARRLSDFARVNRVEGLALGAGVVRRFAHGVSASAAGRYGLSDDRVKARVVLGLRRASGAGVDLFGGRDYLDAGDVMETSLVRNSIAAQEFGSDYTDPYDVRGAGVGVDLGPRLGARWRVEGAYEKHRPLRVNATPANGRYEPTIPARSLDQLRLSLRFERPTALARFGTEVRLAGEARVGLVTGTLRNDSYTRAFASAQVERPVQSHRLVLHSTLGAVSADAPPPQSLIFLGGPTSGPGYDYHAFAAELGASQRVEWRTPVPFPSLPLGRFGRTPASATLAPFAHAVYVSGVSPLSERGGAGWYPGVGVGALLFFDLLRVDVARGMRDGRWTFSLDLAREMWGIL